MEEIATKKVKDKVRTMVIARRELHGVVMDPEHVALAWCVRFSGQIISRTVKRADGRTAFQRAFQRASHPRAMLSAWGDQILPTISDSIFLGTKEVSVGSLLGRLLVRRLPREDAADPVFFNSIRGTPRRLLPDDKPREPREPRSNRCELMYVLCRRVLLFQSTRSHPSYVVCTSEIQ